MGETYEVVEITKVMVIKPQEGSESPTPLFGVDSNGGVYKVGLSNNTVMFFPFPELELKVRDGKEVLVEVR